VVLGQLRAGGTAAVCRAARVAEHRRGRRGASVLRQLDRSL